MFTQFRVYWSNFSNLSRNQIFNFIVNIFDGGFFGLALGFASLVTIVPLFVGNFTQSAILIGLIPAIHTLGWQLPQLFTAPKISKLSLYKPFLLVTTINERLPFLGLAILAWFSYALSTQIILIITFILLIWQGIGGGLAANPWQSMISKVIPSRVRGSFFGLQGGLANLLTAIGAIIAGFIIEQTVEIRYYSIPFLLAFAAMFISLFFLGLTRETYHDPLAKHNTQNYIAYLQKILRDDKQFLRFIASRNLLQFSILGVNFYAVYAVNYLGVSIAAVGIMNGVFATVQIIGNPMLGIISDRFGYRTALLIGTISATLGTGFALITFSTHWIYLAFALAGIANVTAWTIVIAMTLEYGEINDRPAYIGLSNTLTAASTLIAPIVGGWIADHYGFSVTFIFIICVGIISVFVILGLDEPSKHPITKIQFRR